jgi:hypothetical protein
MSIDVGTVITDYSWCEKSRPTITIDEKRTNATVQIGNGWDVVPVVFEVRASDTEDLALQMSGLGELFQKAAEVLA